MSIQAVKGMNDILPGEVEKWQRVEAEARRLFSLYNYLEVRTPIVEDLNLFTRTLGAASAIVEKEMYSFDDRGGKMLALRPEGTASIVRSYIETSYHQKEPLARFYYVGPMYRAERPQRGRYREFHQIGAEVLGSAHPLVDAELIHIADLFFKTLGLDEIELEINSLGCPVCRPPYVTALVSYLDGRKDEICEECRRRIKKNPLRALDCKEEGCRVVASKAPSIHESLCNECESHFDSVLVGLGRYGTGYKINSNIVRGLDYYQRTTFEFTSKDLGAQNAVCGGGRYDGLVRLLGGPHVPGVGFAIGMERLISILDLKGEKRDDGKNLVFIAALGEESLPHGISLAEGLRKGNIAVELNYEEKGLKALMRRADKLAASHAIILGSDEIKRKRLILRDMKGKSQVELPLGGMNEVISNVTSKRT